jgi:uncharacterized protein (UPF0333 family)
VEESAMIYEYVYELITTLFVDPTLLSAEGQMFLELLMLFLAAVIFRFMLSPVGFLFKIAAAQWKAIGGPKTRVRARNFYDKE